MASLQSLVDEWLHLDQDEATRQEINALSEAGNSAELELRLRSRIAFGTAGLRGRMEAGFSRMNSVTVQQATNGLASYVLSQQPDAQQKGIVIGRDARYNSTKFAKLTAATLRSCGIEVIWLGVCHTPLVPFAVQKYAAAAGVMITASHNPANDNGYKVYWSNACQIIPPIDHGIASAIASNLIPKAWDVSKEENNDDDCVSRVKNLNDNYCKAVCDVAKFPPQSALPDFVYTPMHGVGRHIMQQVVTALVDKKNLQPPQKSLKPPYFILEPCQSEPDASFPTVRFPNPEEKGALDRATRTAKEHSIDLVIANDPDADRLAVAEKIPGGEWHQFTGNELGILLGSYVIETATPGRHEKTTLLNSTVSTGMLKVMAESAGFAFEETLTGFKWLGNVALKRTSAANDQRAPYAFEEALGYMFTDVVPDKDGVCAAAVFLAAAATWKAQYSVSPYERLQYLYEELGYFVEANMYLISPSPSLTNQVFEDIRKSVVEGERFPQHLGERKILRWRDLTLGYDSASPDGIPALPVDQTSQMISCWLEGGTKFTVRGSGTEPKIKFYIESQGANRERAQEEAIATKTRLLNDWFSPQKYGFSLP